MEFLPQPHRLSYGEGHFAIRYYTSIVLQNTPPSAFLYAQMLQKNIEKYTGMQPMITRSKAMPYDMVLCIDETLEKDHYRILVSPEKTALTAGSDEALLHSVHTMSQWLRRHGAILPAIEIEDWPDLPNRGYYQDVSRGRVPTLESLKQTADLLCSYKINEWQLYVEHTYLFRNLSEAWRDDTPLTAEDIMELDVYCRERHIDLVPSLASFGHMYKILSTKTACCLCELEDSEKQPFSYDDVMDHHTLNVSHPDAMDFIKNLISEFMPLFTSQKFNICCDETFDLCKGRSAKYAEEHGGVEEQYVSHVSELCRWLLEQGKTPQFWGDIIYRSPETYSRIPEGTVCLNWGYSDTQPDTEVKTLAEMGAVQYTCPGTGTYDQWVPLLKHSYNNIRLMCQYAHKYRCIGLLNTDWGDFGHISNPLFSVPGIIYGAAFSWNSQEYSFEDMNAAISLLHYGQHEGTFVSTFAHLSNMALFDWRHTIRYIERKDPEKRSELFREVLPEIHRAAEINEQISGIVDDLMRQAITLDEDRRGIVQAIAVNAGAIKLFNDIGLYIAVHFEGLNYSEYRNGSNLATDLESWFYLYKKLWRKTSRQSTLHNLQNVIDEYADLLRGRVRG